LVGLLIGLLVGLLVGLLTRLLVGLLVGLLVRLLVVLLVGDAVVHWLDRTVLVKIDRPDLSIRHHVDHR